MAVFACTLTCLITYNIDIVSIGVCLQTTEVDEEEGDVVTRIVPPARVVSTESSGNGFTLLGESEPSHMENLSHRLKVSNTQRT